MPVMKTFSTEQSPREKKHCQIKECLASLPRKTILVLFPFPISKHVSPALPQTFPKVERVRCVSPSLVTKSWVCHPCLFFYGGHDSGCWSHDVGYSCNPDWQESAHDSEPEA